MSETWTLNYAAEVKLPRINVREEIDAFPFDGAYALMRVCVARYGSITPKSQESLFGTSHATNVSIETSANRKESILWGQFAVPGIKGVLRAGAGEKDGRLIFVLQGEVSINDKGEIEALANEIRQYVKVNSIYRGKAIRLTTDNDKGSLKVEEAPRFIDTSNVNANDLFFSDEVRTQIEANLFTLIDNTEACRKAGVPLKHNVLLEGKYGTGKTLTAFVTAQKCERNNWTFILVDRVSGLKDALGFARQYAPAVVFAEDVEREVGLERTVAVDDVLNTIDGIEAKGTEILTVFTTNHIEKVNAAMLRPGRVDAIITTHAPDGKAAEKLVRNYARGLISADTDLTPVAEALSGKIPAVIREVVERAKRYTILKAGGEITSLEMPELMAAIRSMKNHLEILTQKPAPATTPEEQLGAAFKDAMKEALVGNGLYSKVQDIHRVTEELSFRL